MKSKLEFKNYLNTIIGDPKLKSMYSNFPTYNNISPLVKFNNQSKSS